MIKQSPEERRAALRQSIKDDIEIAMILFRKCEEAGIIKPINWESSQPISTWEARSDEYATLS